MADALGSMVRRLRQTCAAPVSELSDTELLSRFVESADPAAFELLTWRHGPLVWGVCRRVLRHEQDAEDAFQATFLALVRKAATIGRRESVGGWLYKVAFRAALAARAAAAKRSSHERAPAEKSCVDPANEAAWHELEPLIDEAIDSLSERYRVAFVLCCVEGLTLQQAAAQLGCPRDTVATRVRRAREQLRARLARHGVALSVGMLSGLVARNAVRAAVPRVLLTATWQGLGHGVVSAPVAGLTQEVLRIMSVQKLFVLVATIILALGGGALAYWKLTPTPQPTGPVSAHRQATRAPATERAGVALAQARAAAREIADPDKRIMLLDQIACEQARAGLFDAAAVTLREALRVALDSGSDICLGRVADYAARLGDTKTATQIVHAFDDVQGQRRNGWRGLCEALARRGDVNAARVALQRLRAGTSEYDWSQVAITRAEARAGHFRTAAATANTIGGKYARIYALTTIGAEQVKAGKRQAGEQTLNEALALAHTLPQEPGKNQGFTSDRAAALTFIARVKADNGAFAQARRLVGQIPSSSAWKSGAMRDLAAAQAAHGDIHGAINTARQITDEFTKGEALCQVVTALLVAKELAAARQLADSIKSPWSQARALVLVGAAEARAGRSESAAKTWQQVRDVAVQVKDTISMSQLKPGLLSQLAAAQAGTGAEKDARAWIAKLPTGLERTWALMGLARGIRGQGESGLPKVTPDDNAPIPGTVHVFSRSMKQDEAASLACLEQHKTRWQKLPRPKAWQGKSFRGQIILFGCAWITEEDAPLIAAINPDGSGLATIYKSEGRAITAGRIAPDGQRLAFSVRTADPNRFELWLLDVSGKARKLSDNAIVAAWSPDGKRLACYRGVRIPWESVLLDIATGKEEPLPLPKTDYVCDWSPDGRVLAVLAYNPDKTFKHPTKGTYPLRKLYLFRLADHHRRDLKADPLSDNIWPRFSPDGRWLAYHQRMQRNGRVPYDAVVYDLKKDCMKDVLSFNETFPGYMNFKANGFPCWSPDGQQIGWLATLHHWWAQPTKMALVVARKAGGLAQQLSLYERGVRFVYAVDWR